MNKVLIVGCHIMGLGVIRALHLKKIEVVALYYEKSDIAQFSRYVSESCRIPHPGEEENQFVNFMISNHNKWGRALVIATNDHAAVSIAKNKKILSKYYIIASPDQEAVQLFIEKEKTYQLAEKSNVPYPWTFSPHNLTELKKIESKISFPCLIKPVKSHEFKSIFHIKSFKIHNKSELYDKFTLCLDEKQSVLIQEIITGPDTNIYKMQVYVNTKGNLVGKFFLGKLRSNPHPYGVGRVNFSTEKNKEVEELSERLLKNSGLKGSFCSIEFKKDLKDNQLKLIENNIRLTRNNYLSTYCGINFPWLMYMDWVKNQQIDANSYKKNAYWIELHSDLLNIILRHKKENIKFHDYVKPYLSHNKTYAIFSLYDPLPFIMQNFRLLNLFLKILILYFHRWIKLIAQAVCFGFTRNAVRNF